MEKPEEGSTVGDVPSRPSAAAPSVLIRFGVADESVRKSFVGFFEWSTSFLIHEASDDPQAAII